MPFLLVLLRTIVCFLQAVLHKSRAKKRNETKINIKRNETYQKKSFSNPGFKLPSWKFQLQILFCCFVKKKCTAFALFYPTVFFLLFFQKKVLLLHKNYIQCYMLHLYVCLVAKAILYIILSSI
jgi:hypothetical protein